MDWNASVLTVTSVVNGPFLGSTGREVPDFPPPDIGAGTLTFGRLSLPDGAGPNGDGALAYITLEATKVGTSTLNLHDVQLTDTAGESETPTTEDGTVEVIGLYQIFLPFVARNYP